VKHISVYMYSSEVEFELLYKCSDKININDLNKGFVYNKQI